MANGAADSDSDLTQKSAKVAEPLPASSNCRARITKALVDAVA